MKEVKVFLKTSSGLVPFSGSDLPKELKETLKSILKDLFPDEEEFKAEKNKVAKEMTIPYYIGKVAERNRVSYRDAERLLSNLWQVNPGAVVQILARAIAMEMDLNYEDHISKEKKVFIISPFDGIIEEIDTEEYFLSYRNIGCFRTKDDVDTACEILGSMREEAYGEQENKGSNSN